MGRVAESACSGDIRVGGAVWSSVGNILSGYIVGFIGIKCRLFFGLLPLRWLLSLDNNGREILWLSMMSYLVIFSFVILRASKFSNAYANVFYKESRGGVVLERNIRKLFEISFVFVIVWILFVFIIGSKRGKFENSMMRFEKTIIEQLNKFTVFGSIG